MDSKHTEQEQMEFILSFLLGLLLGVLIFGKPKRDPRAMSALADISGIMSKQVTHTHRLRLLYEKMPGYHVEFLKAMIACYNYMSPEAQVYVKHLMTEYNELVLDIAATLEDMKVDSQEIEMKFLEDW